LNIKSKKIEDYKIKLEINVKKANEADSMLLVQEERFKNDMDEVLVKVEK